MTPFIDRHGGKSYIIDRRYPGVGRIKRASGTTDKKQLKAILASFDWLLTNGRLDVLRAVRDGDVTPMEAHRAVQTGTVDQLPIGTMGRPLFAAMRAWAADAQVADDTRAGYRGTITALEAVGRADASLVELPTLLRSLRDVNLKAKSMVAFNRHRATAQAFARDTIGAYSTLWTDVARVPRLKEAKPEVRPFFSYADCVAIAAKLPAEWQGPFWTMARTGMGPREYLGPWKILSDRLMIAGTKRETRKRAVPLTDGAYTHWTGTDNLDWFLQQFRKALRAASVAADRPVMKPYDLRRTFARWMESSGIEESRQSVYMGHAVKGMTERYKRALVDANVGPDGVTLQAYLTKEAKQAHGLTVVAGGQS